MKSGLEDRNNSLLGPRELGEGVNVSMKSGLEDRNNRMPRGCGRSGTVLVSMKSGLEDRNNSRQVRNPPLLGIRLNEVRPGRPEQWTPMAILSSRVRCLNEVRPGRPEQ